MVRLIQLVRQQGGAVVEGAVHHGRLQQGTVERQRQPQPHAGEQAQHQEDLQAPPRRAEGQGDRASSPCCRRRVMAR